MYCNKHKCIFVHIPKTGGSSISKALSDQGFVWKDANLHRRLQDMLKTGNLLQQYRIVSCIRNPWDKAVSAFEYSLQCAGKHKGADQLNDDLEPDFNTWLIRVLEGTDRMIHSVSRRNYWLGDCLEWLRNKNGWYSFNFLIRFEQLQEDYEKVCKAFRVEPNKLPHLLKTDNRRPYQEYYSDYTRELIKNHCKLDIEIFGYRFEE